MRSFRVAAALATTAGTMAWAAFGISHAQPAFAGTARFVATTGSDANPCTSGAPCLTVARAVSVASPGDTVVIGPGTFAGQVHIDRSLTVSGAGAGRTTLLQPPTMTADGAGKNDVVLIDNGATVSMSNLTVAGTGAGSCGGPGGVDQGIAVQGGASMSLSSAGVRNIGDPVTNGCQTGLAINIGRTGVGIGHASIASVLVTSYQKGGVVVRNAGSTLKMSGSTITDPPSPAIASNGMEIVDGAVGTVSGNTISGNECNLVSVCGPALTQTQSAGLLSIDAGAGTQITGNRVTANDIGIYAVNSTPAAVTISGNNAGGNRDEDLFIDAGTAAATVTSNIAGGANYGIFFEGPGASGNTFAGNTATGNAVFDLIDDGNTGPNTFSGNRCGTASPSKAHWGCR